MYTKIILLFISIYFFNLKIFSQTPQQPQILLNITVTDGRDDVRHLKIGIDPTASDGIDDHLGEGFLPPFPPLSVFEARFNLPENNFSGTLSSYSDYRNGNVPYSGTKEHRLVFQRGEGDSVVIFWNFPSSVSALLQDIVTGTFINHQMTGEGSFLVPNPDAFNKLKLLVTYNNTTDVDDEANLLPDKFILYQNYPNPFNASTTIRYTLNANQYVKLKIYNVLGLEIFNLFEGLQYAGTHEIKFEAEDLTSGIYFYELNISGSENLSAKNTTQVKSMILLK
ncbi:MAG: T9SS type A sorting domain-containing protein [Ignavibacterium sp.]